MKTKEYIYKVIAVKNYKETLLYFSRSKIKQLKISSFQLG